jgi:integrase
MTAGSGEPNADAVELIPFIKHFIQTAPFSKGTIVVYQVTCLNLEEYQRVRNTTLTFQMIDMDFYNGFISFLKTKNYAPNTIGCRIKMLKKFMAEASDRGIPVRDDYKKKSFAKPSEETSAVYLNETELMQMYRLNFTENPKYSIVRDLFLIGCYTGLRFSDLSKLSPENINADNTISIKTVKTGADVVIPVHPLVRSILEKYGNKLPKMPDNQLFNDRISEVAKLAGINEVVCKEWTKGNERVKKLFEKHELVSSHTARRSFATNAYMRDVPTLSIMKITGHKTEKSFMSYIKMSQKDNALKLQTHSFFTNTIC